MKFSYKFVGLYRDNSLPIMRRARARLANEKRKKFNETFQARSRTMTAKINE